MHDVAIVTDSLACLTRELVDKYGIAIVPLSISFGGKVYRDWIDISPSEAYKLFLQNPEDFSTSPASPGHYLEAFREASKQAKHILCITLSSKLSTGYEMARVAKEQAQNVIPESTIEVLDSQTVTASEGFIALVAARAAAAGKNFTQVIKVAEEIRAKVCFLAVLDTIRHVYRTGRIPKVAARAISLLNIRPILGIFGNSSSGMVRFMGAVRNKEHGIDRIIQMMKENVGNSPVHIAVMHAYAPEEAEKLRAKLAAEFNCAELWITEFSPVMGYAVGTGAVGFAFYKE